jgi:Family of unknown function (DUF6869)
VRVHNPAELAEVYWEHYRRTTSKTRALRLSASDTRWALEEVEDRVRSEPEAMIAVLVAIADAAPDDVALAYLGAGPVEDVIVHHGSDVVIDRIEGAANRSENFRKAVSCAWFDDRVPGTISARLRVFGEPS